MSRHSHLPDPYKVSSVSKLFDEWCSENKYKVPRVKNAVLDESFNPKNEINNLIKLMEEKDRHFFAKAYEVYIKYITAHEKGVLVQSQEALKAIACFRQMIISRSSSQRFTTLFSYLETVQTSPHKHKSGSQKNRLPKVPDVEKRSEYSSGEIVKIEQPPPSLEKVKKHKKKHSSKSNDLTSGKDDRSVQSSLHTSKKSTVSEDATKESTKNDEKSRESSKKATFSDTDANTVKSSDVNIPVREDILYSNPEKENINDNEVYFSSDDSFEDSSTPLGKLILLLSEQTNGLINNQVLEEIKYSVTPYLFRLEDDRKENIPIVEMINNQMEANFLPIESIQILISLLKQIKN